MALLAYGHPVAGAAPARDSLIVHVAVDEAVAPVPDVARKAADWVSERAQAKSQEDHGPWYYSGLPYGSESLIHPVRLVLNGGFGALQFDNRSNRLGDVRLRQGWDRVSQDLRHPVRTIERQGWNDFLRREVLPVSASKRDAQYWPNYTLHLVGGGMSYVMMREWFEQHGHRNPRLLAGVTLAGYHVLNEVVEADRRTEPTTDALADLYLFDPASVLLFSHDGVNRFFSRRLHLRDWSTQPAIDPATGAMENQGQNFSIKFAIPRSERLSVFYYFGNHGEIGLTYTRPDGSAFSAGAGLRAKELVELGNGVQTADLVPSYGFFYDRNGSLLFSLTAAKTSRYRLRVNAYPGLLRIADRTAGLFVLFGRNGETIAGLTLAEFPLGLAGSLRD